MLTEITVESVAPFAHGAEFGTAGPYERVTGTARGEVDLTDPRNRIIVNLDNAPRNARGRVEYATEFYLLRPADPARGNRTILYEVNNRGRKLLFTAFMDAGANGPQTNDPQTVAETGNGLLLRLGYTLVWSGSGPGRAALQPRSGAVGAGSASRRPAHRPGDPGGGIEEPAPGTRLS